MTTPPATGSLWSATCAPLEPLPQLRAVTRADVTVIGAGYTGLSAALHVAAAGREVVALEAAQLGEGGSGLNGGQVIAGLKHDPDLLIAQYGERTGSQLVARSASAPDLVFDLIQRHAIACDAVRTGWMQLAVSESHLPALQRRAEQWRRRGADVAVLSDREAAQLTGSTRYCGGWMDRRGGTVQPLAYVRGLARAAMSSGARIFTRTAAQKLSRSGGDWRVDTPRGAVIAGTVILATDAYTDRSFDSLRRTVVTVPSIQVATAPLPADLRKGILPGGQSVSDTKRLLCYFRLDAAGRLVLGTRGSFGDVPNPTSTAAHERALREIYPALAGAPLQYRWGGFVALTRDGLPHLHELAPGLLAGLGYNGRGIAMATAMGRLLGRRALGESAESLQFPVTPVHPIRLHGLSRLAARATIRYLQVRDALEQGSRRPQHRSAA
ncbi:MAG TPA: FAD-binding oxidoreductase [Steroidobacteraceae bacterium]|nr:FAD-binding oxidoreductase [Steroidobacteraceae bacterium]